VAPMVAVDVAEGVAVGLCVVGAGPWRDGVAVGRFVRVGVAVGRWVGVGEIAGRAVVWTAGCCVPWARAAGVGRTSTYRARVSRKNAQSAAVDRRIRSRLMATPWARRCPGQRAGGSLPAAGRR
jgi:hypothetical protein